ncbi:MAG: hypothetical protein AAF667_19740 [Pseudomonadota bacterium]
MTTADPPTIAYRTHAQFPLFEFGRIQWARWIGATAIAHQSKRDCLSLQYLAGAIRRPQRGYATTSPLRPEPRVSATLKKISTKILPRGQKRAATLAYQFVSNT